MALYLRILGIFLAPRPTPNEYSRLQDAQPQHGRFRRMAGGHSQLDFSNLGNWISGQKLPVAGRKEANIDRTRAKCAERAGLDLTGFEWM